MIHLPLPSLRERKEDVPLLAEHFLERFRRLSSVEVKSFTPRALELLSRHPWPGNVRELENTVQRLVILASQPYIDAADIEANLPLMQEAGEAEAVGLAEVERRHILATLRRLGGHRSQTAAVLGIDRKTLRQKLKSYGLAGE